jgi:hypothetical protein
MTFWYFISLWYSVLPDHHTGTTVCMYHLKHNPTYNIINKLACYRWHKSIYYFFNEQDHTTNQNCSAACVLPTVNISCDQKFCWQAAHSKLLGFWTLCIVWFSKNYMTHSLETGHYHPQMKVETFVLLGPLERANLIQWNTERWTK